MLQSEEQAMTENSYNFSHSLAMYASGNKHSNNSQSSHIIMVDLTKEEAKTIITEVEVEKVHQRWWWRSTIAILLISTTTILLTSISAELLFYLDLSI